MSAIGPTGPRGPAEFPEDAEPQAFAAPAGAATRPIPHNTIPANHPEYWPHEVRSARLPIEVHYRPGEAARAREVLRHLEESWALQLRHGFRPPPLPPGKDALDVYVWRGSGECYAAWSGDNEATAWADAFTYMVVDPEGPHGGAKLRQLLMHELNHVFQGADDWFEYSSAFEGTATFIEWGAGGLNPELDEVVADFQKRADWSIDRDDGGKSWYSYGYAMYLRFLQARYAGGDPSFIGKAWNLARNPPGAEENQRKNRPALSGALEQVLPRMSYAESVAEFARWRWYTGSRADAKHDREAARIPEVAVQEAKLRAGRETRVAARPMMLGASYVEVAGGAAGSGGPDHVFLTLDPPATAGARFIVQAVPGLDGRSDGEVLPVENGRVRVRLAPDGKRTLIVTPVPAAGREHDPNANSSRRFSTTLVLERP